MPEIKFTFTGEERGLIVEALRSAGAIDAAGRAAASATGQLTRQDAAVTKLAIKFTQLERAKAAAGKNLEMATSTGASESKIARLTASYNRLQTQSMAAQAALTSGKLDAMSGSMGNLTGRTDAAASAFSKLSLFAKGAVSVASAYKALDITKEGMAESGTTAKTVNDNVLPHTARFAASGSKTQKELQDTIRKLVGGVGIPIEQAGEYAELFTQGGIDDQRGVKLASQLYQKTTNPLELVRSSIKASQNTGLSVEDAINSALTISSKQGNLISPSQALEGIAGVGMTAKDVLHAKGSETAAFVGQAVHGAKDPAQAFANLEAFIGMLSNPRLAAGMKSEGIAGRMDEFKGRWGGVMAQSPELARNTLGIDAHQYAFMREMYGRQSKIQADQALMAEESKTGGILPKLPSVETKTSLLQRKGQSAAGLETISGSETNQAILALIAERNEKLIGNASNKGNEAPLQKWLRKSIASTVTYVGSLINTDEPEKWGRYARDAATNLGFPASFSTESDKLFSKNLNEGGSAFGESNGDTQKNTQATGELTEAVKALTEVVKKQTDTRLPLPTPSPNYQKNQAQWQNRGN
jgi:hypothetical protein